MSRILFATAALVAFVPAVAPLDAEDPTEAKIRLMAEALRARDAGEIAQARKAAEQLLALAPGDPNVQRLNRQLQAMGAERNAAPPPAAPEMEDVRLPVPGVQPVAPLATPDDAAIAAEAEAAAKAEAKRIKALLGDVPGHERHARRLAGAGKYDEAIAEIDETIQELPLNPLTQKALASLRDDREDFLKERDKAAAVAAAKAEKERARQAELEARKTAEAEAAAKREQERAERVAAAEERERQEAAEREQRRAAKAAPAPADEVAQLALKGRSQYLAGDPVGAEATFRAVQERDPGNAEARGFLLRIARERAATDGKAREQTRAGMLGEVAKGWQRPGVFQERTRDVESAAAAAAPLARKLNDIVLPTVSFTRLDVHEVVRALSDMSEQFDPTGTAPKGVNVVLIDPANKAPAVTITLRNASLKRVLDFVTESIGYQYEIQADAVVVRPGGETSALETAFFPVTRATVLRMMTGAGAAPSAAALPPAKTDPLSSAGASNDAGTAVGGEGPAVRQFLQQAGVNFDDTKGSSLAYDGSSLIVTQTERNLERIRNILNRYSDVKQVEIEAKFMEVQEGALEELGVNWSLSGHGVPQVNATTGAPILDSNGRQVSVPNQVYASSGRSLADAFNGANGGQQGSIVRPQTTDALGNVSTAIDLPILNTAPNLPGTPDFAVSANPLATIAGVIGEFNVNAVVRALSQKQGTDLLSAPKVTVLSGNPATITVAQEMRYPQSFGQTQSQVGTGNASGGGSAGVAITAGTPQEFTKRNVGVELKVTPTVEEDDYSISLDLNPRVTEFDGFIEYGGPSIAISGSTTVNVPSGFFQPIFSVRDITTKVTIWDGATLVMGGLTREEVKNVNDKVPLLGDLPLLGRAFRSKGESAQKRNLLIFVTANLVSPGGSPKKQNLPNVAPNSLFQNPTIVTPAGSERRVSGAR
ncbi:MAG TPA: type II secretory pathway, component PulD [Opitutus sp.]|nr:type II secretory pathway, component PulD [Opitutus sp.]